MLSIFLYAFLMFILLLTKFVGYFFWKFLLFNILTLIYTMFFCLIVTTLLGYFLGKVFLDDNIILGSISGLVVGVVMFLLSLSIIIEEA